MALSKAELLASLSTTLDEWERQGTFGNLEIEVRDGKPILIRKITTQKIEDRGQNTHAKRNRY